MLSGIYTSASAMIIAAQRVNNIANNIANSNTIGFKSEGINQKSWSEFNGYGEAKLPIAQNTQLAANFINEAVNSVVHMDKDYINFTQGSLEKTGNKLDFAIEGRGFFAVLTPNGIEYTRGGQFGINSQGILVQRGTNYPVLGENYFKNGKFIKVDSQTAFSQTGAVLDNGAQTDTIAIRDFSNYGNLRKVGDNCFVPVNNMQPQLTANFMLKEGYLEQSNVNIVKEMVELIQNQRSYDSYQKVISTFANQLIPNTIQIGSVT
ncbi:Flagellar basal-body rod protein FlgG [Desulfurella amilsii]|uniref:Flagellar basal-body rod protein FlgF n=1 Tax=Desulfurella amilsii TaxID=1562698 RepID=A0A1X4XZ51_9BACT|nr:flagellar hook-basal body protein [Desulfurella amilsii]OSS42739.1 Flagellar basal-body rod protein FlgF [Desulfurella amilsii]OSS42815.1 Flagellar basal-body rod protein FlgG [Desulfurella amilsii]